MKKQQLAASAKPSSDRYSSICSILKSRGRQTKIYSSLLVAALAVLSSANAGTVTKANNSGALNLGTSWVGGVAPTNTDVAQWDGTVSNPNNATNDLGTNVTWAGIKILNPAAAIGITTNSAPATLTLNGLGIDMSSATVDLTMSNDLAFPVNTVNALNVPSGRTLSLEGAFSRVGGSVISVNGAGTVNIAGLLTGTNMNYCLVNGTDCGAIDGSLNVSTIATVITYSQNTPGSAPTTPYLDIVNSATGVGGLNGTGDDVYLNNTIYFPSVIRFNTPQVNRNYWYYNVRSGQNSMAANSTVTVLVTTNVGAEDCIISGTSHAFRWSSSGTGSGAELIIDQENTAGNLFINGAMSQKAAAPANMITKRGAGRVVFNASLVTTGPTRILEGNLMVNGSSVSGSPFLINAAGTLSGAGTAFGPVTNNGAIWPGNTNGAGHLIVGTAVLNAGSSLRFYAETAPTTNTTALLDVTNLTVNGTVNVSILSGLSASGEYPLIFTPGGFSGATFANFTLASMPPHTGGYLTNNTTASTIDLVITNVSEPLDWATGSGTWDINTTANWKDSTGAATTSQEVNGTGDQAVFEDTQSGTSPITISLNTTVHPSAVTFNSSKNFTLSGNGDIAGSSGLTVAGSGTVTLATTNTYTGPTVLNGGTTVFSTLNNLGLDSITFGGGTLQYSGNTDDLSTRVVTFASGQSAIDIGANNVTFSNAIGNNGAGGFTKLGSGTLTLNGTNNYSGNTIVSQGTLALGASTYISNSAAIMVNSGATLDAGTSGVGLTLVGGAGQILGGSGTIRGTVISTNGVITPGTNGVVGTLTFANDLQIAGGTLNIDISTTPGQSDLIVVGGALTLSGGTVQLNVTGTLPNGRYKLIQYGTLPSGVGSAGNVAVAGFSQPGQLAVLSDSTPGEIDLLVEIAASDALTWSGTGTSWDTAGTLDWLLASNPWPFTNGDFVTFDDSGAANPVVNLKDALLPGSVTVNNSTTTYTFADGTGIGGGKISGNTSIVKKGTGTLIVATANNNFGPTDLEGGTMQIGNGGTLGDLGTGAVTNNGTLVFNQLDNHTVAGVISGAGSLTQQGSGVVTLAANNTYTGPTTIASSGSLQVGNGGAAGSLGSGAITNDGTLIYDKSGTLTVGNIKTGPANGGALSFTGPATVTLNHGSTYINNTYINNGLVKVAFTDSIPSAVTVPGSTGWLVLDGGASTAGTLDLNGFSINVNALSGTNNTVNGTILNSVASHTNTLIINGTATTSFSGTIKDNGGSGGKVSVLVTGGANQTFDVESTTGNTYTGGTVVSNATLILTAATTIGTPVGLGTGPITLLSNAVLSAVGASPQNTGPTWSSLNNTINIPAGQAATINGVQRGTMQGNITGAGTLTYAAAYVRGTISGNWSGFTGQIIWTGSGNGGNLGIAGAATNGFGRLLCTNAGAGAVTFYNTVAGTPTIRIGELADDGSATIESTTSGNAGGVAANFAIGSSNTSTTFGGSIIDNVGIIKVGTGTLTLSGATLTYTGPTAVSNGVLVLTAATPPSTRFAVQAPGILDISSQGILNVGTIAQTLDGNGTVRGSLAVGPSGIVNVGFNNAIGTLTVTNDVNLAGTNFMELNNTNAVGGTNDQIASQTMTLGGTLIVTNIGARLHVGDTFKLFKTTGALSGSFSTVILPTNDVGGVTYTWTDNTAVNGSITVATVTGGTTAPTVSPAITSISLAGGNIILNGTNAQAGATYYLLTSTNVAAPVAQWKTIGTNVAPGNNAFSFTNGAAAAQPDQYYILSSTNYNP